MITIDIERNPDLHFRIDNFSVPDASREEFERAMRRNLAYISELPGFLGHMVFDRTAGDTPFNIATIAVWASQEAIERAAEQVRSYYASIGFDVQDFMKRLGITSARGNFRGVGEELRERVASRE
jgi:hypothetical protein